MTADFQPFCSVAVTVGYAGKPPVLRDLFLQVRRGEVLGLVGGSGSGKSTLALAMMKLLDSRQAQVSGHVYFCGRDLLQMTERELRRLRGRELALVLQSPAAALNPMLKLGTQLREAWRAHQSGSGEEAIAEALRSVQLPADASFLKRYPAQISAGQGQRVLIAMAILHRPSLLIADEPTSALDAITQQEVLQLLRHCNRKLGMSIVLISHNLAAVAAVCDRVAVLDQGRIVECGEADQILNRPAHDFTRRLTGHAFPRLHKAAAI